MKIIAITNNKGGVGKTTTTLNIGAALVQLGHKVLLIDMDAQANLSSIFRVAKDDVHNVGAFMLKDCSFEDAVRSANGLDIIPASNALREAEEKLSTKLRKEDILKTRLLPIKDQYDFILIDCPPNLALMTINAIFAADYYLAPLEAGYFSYQGIGELIKSINEWNDLGATAKLLGVLVIKYHPNLRDTMKQEIVNSLQTYLKDSVLSSYIRTDSNLDKAQLNQNHIFGYAQTSNAAKDYMAVTKEILGKITI